MATLPDLIKTTNSLVDEIRKLAANHEAEPGLLTQKMTQLEQAIADMRTFPDAEWQQARNDILGLTANFDTMQQTLNAEYDKARNELTQLSSRTNAQKMYAAYNQPETQAEPKPEKEEEKK